MYVVTLLFIIITFLNAASSQNHESRESNIYYKTDKFGQYALQYSTPDGTLVREQGGLKRTPFGYSHVLVKRGSYRYISPEGKLVYVRYFADEHGYHPISNSIPKPPSR